MIVAIMTTTTMTIERKRRKIGRKRHNIHRSKFRKITITRISDLANSFTVFYTNTNRRYNNNSTVVMEYTTLMMLSS